MGSVQAYLCERLGNEGKRTTSLAYNVLERYDNCSNVLMKQKLFIFAQQAGNRSPRFTAWGYFDINHEMIFMLSNLTITYVIVLVQLKMPGMVYKSTQGIIAAGAD